MRKFTVILALLFVVALVMAVLASSAYADANNAKANDNACWGQASAVFAQTGVMGEHASQEETPRVGLHNLAVALFKAGEIEDASLQALGAYVASALGLSIDACM